MIIRTQIKWTEKKEEQQLSEQEIARREFYKAEHGIDAPIESDEEEYDEVMKDGLIDIKHSLIYVDIGEGKIAMTRLLDGNYMYDMENTLMKLDEKLVISGNLDELEKQLRNKNK